MLLAQSPGSHPAHETYLLKGDILNAVREYGQAADMFDQAAVSTTDVCRRSAALLRGSRVRFTAGSEKEAVRTLRMAHTAAQECENSDSGVYGEIGILYMRHGFPEEALTAFDAAAAKETSDARAYGLKIMMARCHEMLADSESYLAIYTEVAEQGDPFWGRIAREKVAEIDFNTLLEKEK